MASSMNRGAASTPTASPSVLTSPAIRWVVWGTILLGGVLGTLAGVRATLWIAYAGSWAAGWWVFFSPLRRQRDLGDSAT